MPLTLDPGTEARIQQEIDLGHYSSPDELLNRALDALSSEQTWSEEEKQALEAKLAESEAQFARGEFCTADQAQRILDERIAQRTLRHAL